MGFLSSLTDAFTGAPAKQAAADTRGYLGGVQTTGNNAIDTGVLNARSGVGAGLEAGRDALGAGYTTSRGDVGTGADRALGSIGSGRDAALAYLGSGARDASGYIDSGTRDAQGYLSSGANNALGYLDKGYGDASGLYDSARGAYAPLSALGQKYGGATTLGLNALGVNGAGGQTSARDAFAAGPGYNFNLDQGLEAINRRRNMGGMLDSGNADRDAQKFGAGLASNEYDKWLGNLLGFTNPELSATSGAASGIAGVNQNQAGAANQLGINKAGVASALGAGQAGLASGAGTARAGIASTLGAGQAGIATDAATAGAGVETGRAAMLSDLASRYGLNSANLEGDAGKTLAGIETGAAGQKVALGSDIAKPYANTYGQEAAAQQGGSANLWNLGINAAKLAAGRWGTQVGQQPAAA